MWILLLLSSLTKFNKVLLINCLTIIRCLNNLLIMFKLLELLEALVIYLIGQVFSLIRIILNNLKLLFVWLHKSLVMLLLMKVISSIFKTLVLCMMKLKINCKLLLVKTKLIVRKLNKELSKKDKHKKHLFNNIGKVLMKQSTSELLADINFLKVSLKILMVRR